MNARVVDGRLTGATFLDDPHLRRVFDALDGNGEEVRVVGGSIRNALMGVSVHEIDLATTAIPAEIDRRARAAGLRTIPTGIDHGTITVLVDASPFEVTTLRHDVETDGRRAVVRFGRSFEEDALRRDFTINALSARRDGTLFDYTGGVADIAQQRVRFIGEARQRIREDYLRILRFFRFHAAFGEGPMEPEAFAAVIAEHAGMERLSRERVRSELLKLLVARRGPEVTADVAGAGILGPLLGGVPNPERLKRIAAIEAAAGRGPDAVLRLAALRTQTLEDADILLDALRLSNAEHGRLVDVAGSIEALHGTMAPPTPHGLRALLFRRGRETALDALRLLWADSRAATHDRVWLAADAFLNLAERPRLPFRGADLLRIGVPAGPAIGAALARLESLWVDTDFSDDPARLDALLKSVVAGAGSP